MRTAGARSYVLVVDDNEDIRVSVEEILQADGFAVRVASNGLQALEVLRAHDRAALVLLDMMMPVMDGETFRSRQLADPSIRPVPVIVMTASDRDLGHLRLVAILRKPFDPESLLELVGAWADRAPVKEPASG
jgi:CheY-like chemotaxis protein